MALGLVVLLLGCKELPGPDIVIDSDNRVVTITEPAAEAILYIGQKVVIHWNTTKGLIGDLKIDLMDGDISVQELSSQTPNTGSFNWKISNSQKTGSYRIRLTIVNSLFKGDSWLSDAFTISQLTVTFVKDETVTPTGTGAINHNFGTEKATYGDKITLLAKADESSTFTEWIVNGEHYSSESHTTIIIKETTNITAVFMIKRFPVTFETLGNGTGIMSFDITNISNGTTLTGVAYGPHNMYVSPTNGSSFEGWIVNNVLIKNTRVTITGMTNIKAWLIH